MIGAIAIAASALAVASDEDDFDILELLRRGIAMDNFRLVVDAISVRVTGKPSRDITTANEAQVFHEAMQSVIFDVFQAITNRPKGERVFWLLSNLGLSIERRGFYYWVEEEAKIAAFVPGYLPAGAPKGADLSGIDLHGYHFEAFVFNEVNFESANLTGCDFYRSKFQNTNFNNAILRNVNFEECDLVDASFEGADLTGAKLSRAEVKRNAVPLGWVGKPFVGKHADKVSLFRGP